MNKELTKNCVQCNTEFNYKPNKLNEQKYCSKVCRTKANNIRRIQLIRDEYTKIDKNINADSKLFICVELLCNYIKQNKILKTSVTTAFGQINIENENWQVQIRLENNDFLEKNEIVEDFMTIYKNK